MNLANVLEELIQDKGIDKAVLSSIIEEGILAACELKYPSQAFRVVYVEESQSIDILVEKAVVNTVTDEKDQISLRRARIFDPKILTGMNLWVPFEGKIGRIEIVRARQVIAAKIREVEAKAIYDEFKSREGDVIIGTVYKKERSGTIVKVDDALAFLPRSLSLPEDRYEAGMPIRATLKEVLEEPRNDNQLILDRSSENFLRGLIELEIPEVFERVVEIKSIARSAGYKSKIAVVSTDKNVDPVGTCIGVGGSRIRPILKEISGEKIDVIHWTPCLEDLVAVALKPAKIRKVSLEDRSAKVWLDDDQRSLAIGKGGQNISLASRLTGVDIQLAQSGGSEETDSEGSLGKEFNFL